MTYRVVNSENATNGWQAYDEDSGATVSPESYAVDLPESAYQTIIFNNLYTRAGMLNVWKVDPVTRDGIARATFNLKDADGNAPTLYHKPSTNEYSTDASSAEQEGFTEKVSSIVTGASGRFSVKLATNPDTGNATYYLEESLPFGCDGVKKIKLTVDASGNVNETYAQNDISNPSLRLQNDWLEGVGTPTLTIKNVSKEYISVCAEKDWGNTAQDRQLPVVVELCRNNTPPEQRKWLLSPNAER